jgi:septal ring factor EnvC (AmiA/AmiB activator)
VESNAAGEEVEPPSSGSGARELSLKELVAEQERLEAQRQQALREEQLRDEQTRQELLRQEQLRQEQLRQQALEQSRLEAEARQREEQRQQAERAAQPESSAKAAVSPAPTVAKASTPERVEDYAQQGKSRINDLMDDAVRERKGKLAWPVRSSGESSVVRSGGSNTQASLTVSTVEGDRAEVRAPLEATIESVSRDSNGSCLTMRLGASYYLKVCGLDSEGLRRPGTRVPRGAVVGYVGDKGKVTVSLKGRTESGSLESLPLDEWLAAF